MLVTGQSRAVNLEWILKTKSRGRNRNHSPDRPARRPRRAARLQEHHESRDGAGRAGAGPLGPRVGSAQRRHALHERRAAGDGVHRRDRRAGAQNHGQRAWRHDPGTWRRDLRRRRRHRDAISGRDGHARRGTFSDRRQSADASASDRSAARRDATPGRQCVQRARQQLPAGDRRCVAGALRRRRNFDRRARLVAIRLGDADAGADLEGRPQAAGDRRRGAAVHRHDAPADGSVGRA